MASADAHSQLSPVARALWSGAAGGFVAGVLDVLLAWGPIGQFVHGFGTKLWCALFVGSICGFFTAIAAAAVAVAIIIIGRTRLGELVRFALRSHDERRARDPGSALVALSLTLTGLPLMAGALGGAFVIGYQTILLRQHKGLVVVVIMAATLGLLATAVVLAFALGRLVEIGLAQLAHGKAGRTLSHPAAPLIAAVIMASIAAAIVSVLAKETLSLINLRPVAVGLGVAALSLVAFFLLRRWFAWLARTSHHRRHGGHAALVGGLLALTFFTGASQGVRKAATLHSGLGGLLSETVRRIIDLDRDGHSPVLGGGDCNDWDATVYQGAPDMPGDGIDQNCLGKESATVRSVKDVGFVPLPNSVPADTNVLFITVDTLRSDHVGAYGYTRNTTPTLDAIAKEGIVFENGWAHSPSTRYSMPAVLTGRHPSQILWDRSRHPGLWWPGLQLANDTLGEVCKRQGFATGAILAYDYFAEHRRMNQGIDEYDNKNAVLHRGRDPSNTRGTSSQAQADKAIAFVERHKDERFFLWVHFYDPHYQYETHAGVPSFGNEPTDRYDHEVFFTDQQIGRVISKLQRTDVYKKTVVIVTGDHGEGFGEHGIKFHGYHLYTQQTKVPFVFRVPGLTPKRVSMPVAHVDILPTLANLVGGKASNKMMGRSLLAEMSGQADADAERIVFQEVKFEGPTERYGAASKCLHLLYNMIPDNTFELYDICNDPDETKDIAGDSSGDKIKKALLSWIDSGQVPPETLENLQTALLKAKPTPQQTLNVRFGNSLTLLGLDHPSSARRGQTMDLVWYFEATGNIASGWKIFVHIEGPRGARFLGDHQPAGGMLPFATWRPGQFIADKQTLTVPPNLTPGTYTIYFGLFRGNQRMPIQGGGAHVDTGDRVRAGTFQVLP